MKPFEKVELKKKRGLLDIHEYKFPEGVNPKDPEVLNLDGNRIGLILSMETHAREIHEIFMDLRSKGEDRFLYMS